MSHENRDYVQILRMNGYRATPQRLLVLDAVCALGGHATVSAIQAKVHFYDPSIDRSTVYRALQVLTAVGLVTERELDRVKIYRIAGEARHHHLTCQRCGKTFTVPDTALHPFLKQIQAEYGFRIHADHLVFHGWCAACASAPVSL